MQENPLSLEEVKSHFEHWRATRAHIRERTPQHLWDKVKLLIDRYPLPEIAQALRLTIYQIRDNLRLQSKINFAEATIEPSTIFNSKSHLSVSTKGHTYSVEFQRPNGAILRVGSLSAESINKIISQFIG